MSSITIAYGASGIRGTIASKVADELGYELIGRSVLQAASQTYNIEESKLAYVIHHGPSFFGISETTRNRYLACVLAASAGFLLKDNVVFNGPAGFLIAQGVSHILKVRMVPTLEDRIAFIMERDNLSHEKAEHTVSRDEKDRKKWSSKVFGIDDSDTNHYDLNIEFDRTNEERIIERIVSASRDKRYQPMTYSWRCIGNKE